MKKKLSEVLPPPEQLLGLEREEVGVLILEFFNGLDEGDRGLLNRYNFTLQSTLDAYAGARYKEVAEVLTEGWMWLLQEGLLAPQPGSQGEWVFITRRGKALQSSADVDAFRKSDLLREKLLDPALAQKAKPPFIRGDYEEAVFAAFKEVEVRVRSVAGLAASDIGVELVRKAFHPETGPLTDRSLVPAEREATSHLFAGAMGLLKNPSSHRHVEIQAEEAAELIHFANYLLRLVESRRRPSA